MEKEKKTLEVEMIVEEAAELFDSSLSWSEGNFNSGYLCSNFMGEYGFTPKSISELAAGVNNDKRLKELERTVFESPYSSGNVYLARRKGKELEFIGVNYIDEDFWKKNASNRFSTHGVIKADEMLVPSYAFYSNQHLLDLDKVADYFKGDFNPVRFTLPEKGNVSLRQASELPIWNDKGDYEKLVRESVGKLDDWRENNIFLVDGYEDIGRKWGLYTTSMSARYNVVESNPIFRPLSSCGKLVLSGAIQIPDYPWNNLERQLIQDYVKPQNLENGVIVMNEDRVPKYLKRVLGLGGGR